MKTNYSIKNFRVFDNNGISLSMKPITILTGCNSSGKSSIVKSVFLLDSFLKQIKNALDNNESIELNKYKFDFTQYPNNLLGRFDRVVNNNSDTRIVTVEYSVYSTILSCNLDVRMEFCADEKDELNNAYLKSLTVLREGVIVFSSDKEGDNSFNLNSIKDQFYSFVETEYIVHNYCGLEFQYEFDGKLSDEEYKAQKKIMFEFLRSIPKYRRDDVFKYVRAVNNKDSLVHTYGYNPELLEWSKSNDSFFNIPVIEWLNTINKNEIKEKLDEILGNKNNAEIIATNKVVDAFLCSEFDTFGVFFKSKEEKFMDNAIQMCPNASKRPFVPSLHNLEIYQDYMEMDPHHIICGSFNSLFEENISKEEKDSRKQKEIKEWEERVFSFEILYETVMYWNSKYNKEKSSFYAYKVDHYAPFGKYVHSTYEMLCAYACRIIEEVILPDWTGNMSYVSSSRVSVSRLYTLDVKDDFTQLLAKYFEKKRSLSERTIANIRKEYKPNSFINKWVKLFGIGESVTFHVDDEGLGVQIRLHKETGDKGRLLADEGYGITQIVSILLQIETAILSAKGETVNNLFRLENLDGYDSDKFHYEINTIAIEEPEIHLHPRLQSLLAEMFVDAYKNYNIHFLVETHSEYLIRKLQTNIAKKDVVASDVSLVYVNDSNPNNRLPGEAHVRQIGVAEDGRLKNSFGSGFFDEADSMVDELFNIKMKSNA